MSGEEELNLQHKHIVKSVNFSDDSTCLATGSNDKVIRIFDLERANEGPKVSELLLNADPLVSLDLFEV